MLGECRRVFTNAGNTAGRLKKFNGLDAEALYHPPRLADRLAPGDLRRLRAVGRPARDGQARDLAIEPWPMWIAPIELAPGRRRHPARQPRGAGQPARRRRPRPVPRRRRRRDAADALRRRARRRLLPVRRGLRLRDARELPGAQTGRHRHRLGRPDRVRRGRRQRRAWRRPSPRRSATRSTGTRARRRTAAAHGDSGLRRARGRSPGTASIETLVGGRS